MKRILGPHKEQNGWRYIRVPASVVVPMDAGDPDTEGPRVFSTRLVEGADFELLAEIAYDDDVRGARVISSRRVEEAVETADYLKLCAEEGLCALAIPFPNGICWDVFQPEVGPAERERKAYPLREAYHRYKAAQS